MARPLKYPVGMPRTAATYRSAARAALRDRGGRIVTLQLEAEHVALIEALRRPGETDAGVIINALRRAQGLD